jgi:enoyl-CoA hydratase/carnithine racemase
MRHYCQRCPAGAGSLARLARQIAYAPAMRILLTGAEVSAARMAELARSWRLS